MHFIIYSSTYVFYTYLAKKLTGDNTGLNLFHAQANVTSIGAHASGSNK